MGVESVRTRLGIVSGEVSLRISRIGGPPLVGAVHAIRARGVVARFQKPDLPSIPLARQFNVEFYGGGILHPYTTAMRMDAWQDSPEFRAYLFAPENPELFESEFVEPFHRGDLRRKSPRLTPEPENPPAIGASAHPHGPFINGKAVDLSIDGMQLWLPAVNAAAVADADRLWVRITPPGTTTPLLIKGDVRHAHLVLDQFSYGVRFDWEKTPETLRVEAALTAYVMRLQQLHLAARVDRPKGSKTLG